jgi:site-specific DNA recombinase
MRIAIYVRVSTQRQAQTQTIDQQIDRLRAHVESQGWQLPPDSVFRDDGYSGAALKRPGLDRLRDRAALASFDAILLTDPDRLARNYVHQVLLLEELQKHGCRVEFVDRPMSRDPHDRLLLQIRGAVAEYERTLIAERTRRGRQRQFRAGKMLPWTRPPYAYRMAADRPRDPSGVYQDPAEAAVVAEIFAWYLQGGHTLHKLVDHLHGMGFPSPSGKPYWSVSSVRGVLTNPVYTGRVFAGRTRYRDAKVRRSATHPIGCPHGTAAPVPEEEWIEVGAVPAIVSREQFDAARAKLATNQSLSARNNKVGEYLLRSLVSCGRCGLASMARRLPPSNTYYLCTGKTRQARHRNGKTCDSRYVPSRALDDLVWQDLVALLRHPEMVAEAFRRASVGSWHPQEFQSRRERLRQGKASLAQQLERLTEAYLGGIVPLPEYRRRRVEIEARVEALGRQESSLAGEADRLDQVLGLAASLESFCGRVSQGLEGATFDRKRQLVELLIDRVIVTGDEIEIRYVFPTCPESEHVRFCHLRSDYLQRLHLALLVDREDDGVLRRAHIQADHVADLLDEVRVGRELEGPAPVGLQAEGVPDPDDGALGQPHSLRHATGTPMGGGLGLLLQGRGDDLLDPRVGDLARGTGAGFVGQPFEAVVQEASPPLADGHGVDAESGGDGLIVQALGTGQDDPGASREALCALGSAGPGPELLPLVVAEDQGGFGATAFAHHMSPLQDHMIKEAVAQG